MLDTIYEFLKTKQMQPLCAIEREVGILSNFKELTLLNIFSFLTKKHDAFLLEPPLRLHLKWPSDIHDAQCSCRKSRFIHSIECNTCSVIYIYCKFSETFFILVTNCRSREHIDWKWYIFIWSFTTYQQHEIF